MNATRPSAVRLAGLFGLALAACDVAETAGLPDAGAPPAAADAGTLEDAAVAEDAGASAGRVRLDRERLDLGRVVVGSTRTASLFVENPSGQAVEVTLTEPSGSDAEAFSRDRRGGDAHRFELEPGARVEIEVTVAPRRAAPLVATLALDACAGACPVAILLRAEGVDAGLRCDERLDLGLVNLGACRRGRARCENSGNLEETIETAAIAGDAVFTLASPFAPVRVAPGATSSVAFELCPRAAGGAQATLQLEIESARRVTRRVALRGEGGGADVRCAPAALDYGVVPVGVGVVRELTCSNAGLDAARLRPRLASSDFRLLGARTTTVPPGSSALLRVEALASSAGAKQAELQVDTNDPDTPTLRVPLRAEARAVVPCALRTRPSRLDLGRVAIGSEVRAAVGFENDGSQACDLASAGLVRAPAGMQIEGALPASLPAGDRVELGVRFAPRAAGSVRAGLEVGFGDAVTPPLSVEIAAEVTAPELLAAPGAIDFGEHPAGCGRPATRVVEVHRLAGAGSITRVQLAGGSTAAFGLIGVGQLPNRLEAGETLTFGVSFEPTQVGYFAAELRVFSGATAPLVVPLLGSGSPRAERSERASGRAPVIDLLFVVDDSGSMGPTQAALSRASTRIADRVRDLGADVHLGVVTTDLDDPTTAGALAGNPAFLTASTPELEARLAARLAPGVTGSGTEQSIGAAARALSPPLAGGSNNGFLRPGADLEVVIVSDEDDASTLALEDAVLALRAAAGSGRLGVHALVGPPSGAACDGIEPAPRIAAFTRLGGGVLGDLCGDFGDALDRILDGALGPLGLRLEGEPRPSSLRVTVGGQSVPRAAGTPLSGFAYAVDDRRVRFFGPADPPRGLVEVRYDVACATPRCGDARVQGPEQCDDANSTDTDACVSCLDAACGDRVVWSGNEACDDGNTDPADACLPVCVGASCGDGVVQAGVEDCDDGNTQPGDGCPSTCRFYRQSGPSFEIFRRLRSGTVLRFSGGADPEDEGWATVRLPFAFDFFGVSTSTLTVSPNGVVGVGPGPRESYRANASFPHPRFPKGVIAPWWDDLVIDTNVSRRGASVAYEVFGTAPNRRAVVQWRDLRLEDQSTRGHRRWRFQLQIDEATSVIRFHYGDTEQRGFNFPSTYSASVGLESPDGRVGVIGLPCSPDCDGRPRRLSTDFHYPESEVLTFTPEN